MILMIEKDWNVSSDWFRIHSDRGYGLERIEGRSDSFELGSRMKRVFELIRIEIVRNGLEGIESCSQWVGFILIGHRIQKE